jgi:hypothetical protein
MTIVQLVPTSTPIQGSPHYVNNPSRHLNVNSSIMSTFNYTDVALDGNATNLEWHGFETAESKGVRLLDTINSVKVFIKSKRHTVSFAFMNMGITVNLYGYSDTKDITTTANWDLDSVTFSKPGGGSWSRSDIDNATWSFAYKSLLMVGDIEVCQIYIEIDYTPTTFTLKGDTYTVVMPLPKHTSGIGTEITKDLSVINFWGNDIDITDKGINAQPLKLTGEIQLASNSTLRDEIDYMMEHGEEICISSSNCESAIYIIKSFNLDTIEGSPGWYTWSFELEFVREA